MPLALVVGKRWVPQEMSAWYIHGINNARCLYPLLIWMKLTGTEDTSTHVTLRAFAQILVLVKDLLVKLADVGKLLVWGVLVSVNLILNFACCWSCGNHALNIKEIVTICQSVVHRCKQQ